VCGSRSEATLHFVAEARRLGLPVFAVAPDPFRDSGSVSGGEDDLVEQVIDGLRAHGRVVLASGGDIRAIPGKLHPATQALTRLARRVIREASVSHVSVEGGATAAALLAELGGERLRPVYEWAPGVVTLETCGNLQLFLTLKPGSYEWPEALRSLLPVGISAG
jgi:uncharacterized protein YgbK (DUF1537 family)